MARAADFARRMSRLGQQVSRRFTARTNQLALNMVQGLLEATPVDTGQAISNWIVSLQGPDNGQVQPYVPGQFGSTHQANITAAYNSAVTTIGGRRPGVPIYIQNNLDYIRRLNDGWSNQAPSGFFQTTILDAVSSVRGVRVLETRF